ncbi:c-type cytochrome [Massilia brevitalea]|uniref:c-type cytochrome n=1 Tax=Massilia brevitalea TaxID=442526 RepID=UPI002738D1A5|nr:cytochrome c [Massilia brevitalea]
MKTFMKRASLASLRTARCTALCAALCWSVGLFAAALPRSALAGDTPPYKVAEGNKVDAQTLSGWKTWRAMACERCHGAAQEGMVGPSLVDSLKVLSKDQFKTAVLKGRIEKGMPNFDGSKMVTENIDSLYAYLKGRSDGAIEPGRLQEIGK